MTKIFISYSRKDKAFAGRLVEALAKSELETWIDWEDIPPTADWMDQIHKGIEEADGFLFLFSPDSVASKVCGQEVDHAVQNGKRLIPIVARDVNPNDVHLALAKVNWIYCRESDDFEGAVEKTLSAIRTDLAWVEAHKRLQVRAIEWDKRTDRSLLLRGKDLREAEEQLASAGQKDPQPTDLQRRYVLESRRRETRTRNLVMVIGAVVIAALALLSVFAIDQRDTAVANENSRATAQGEAENQRGTAVANEHVAQTAQANAEEQARIALSRQLAAQADAVRDEDLSLSLLLSMESLRAKQTSEAKNALLQDLRISPEAFILETTGEPVTSLAVDPGENILASGGENGAIFLWDISSPARAASLGNPLQGHSGSVNSLAFSPDGLVLASGSSDDTIIFWDISNPAAPIQLGKPLQEHTSAVIHVSYRQHSQIFVSISLDSTVNFWDVSVPSTPVKLGSFNLGYETGLGSVAVSPDGRLLASTGVSELEPVIHLWDISNPAAPLQFENVAQGETTSIISLAFSPDGNLLASGSMDNTILFFDITDPANPGWIGEILDINTTGVPDIAFGFDGTTLACGSSNGAIYLWGVSNPSDSKKRGVILSGHTDQVSSVIFDPYRNVLASAGLDGRIILWDIYTPYAPIKPEAPFLEQAYGMSNVVFSPDGEKLAAAGGYDEPVIVWDISSPSAPLRLGALPAEQTKDAAFGEDGDSLMLVQDSYDPTQNLALTIWDVSNPSAPKETGRTLKFTNSAGSITFNTKRKLAASEVYDTAGDFTTDVVLWDISNPAEPTQLGTVLKGYAGIVNDLKFSPY